MNRLFVGFLLLVLTCGCNSQARRERHFERAEKFFDSDRYAEAVVEYMNVLRLDPAHAEAVRKLGVSHAATGNLRASIPFTLKAAEMLPDDPDLQMEAGRIYLLLGQIGRARTAAERILELDPEALAGYLLLADTSRKTDDVDAALERLAGKVEQFDGEAVFHAALAELHLRKRDLETAEAALNRALEINPDIAQVHQTLGLVYQRQGDMDKAAAEFRTGAELAPDDPRVQIKLVQFKLQTGEATEARQILEAFVERLPESGMAQLELAKLDFKDRQFEATLERLEKILELAPNHMEALILRSRAWLMTDRAEEAVETLERLVERYPRHPRLQYELGLAYITVRDLLKAVDALDEAIALAPTLLPARLLRAETHIRRGNAEEVVAELRTLRRQLPKNEKVHLLLGAAYSIEGQRAKAVEVYRSLVELKPDSARSLYLLGKALLSDGQRDEARSTLESAREIDPDFQPAFFLLTAMDVREDQHDTAMARVQARLEAAPESARLLYLMGIIQVDRKDYDAAELTFRQTIDVAPDTLGAYMMLGRIFAVTGKTADALGEIERAVEVAPRNVSALMLAAVLQADSGNHARAAEYYEQILAIESDFYPALNNLAYLCAEKLDNLDRALDLALQARQAEPDNAFVADTLGWVAYKRGDYGWALAMIREGADQLSGYPEVLYHAGLAQAAVGRETAAASTLAKALEGEAAFSGAAEAAALLAVLRIDSDAVNADDREVLDALLALDPDNAPALHRLAILEEGQKTTDKARDIYERIRTINPFYLPSVVRLARLYERLGEKKKALELARDAQERAGDDPEVQLLLGGLAYESGQYTWAAGLLRSAAEGLADDAMAQYRFGQAQLAVGKMADARALLDKALKLDGRFAKAEVARRTLRMLGVAAGRSVLSADLQQARDVLAEDPSDLAALYAVAAVLSRQGEATAVSGFEDLLARYPDFVPAARDLAALYLKRGEKADRAYTLATQARREMPVDPKTALVLGKVVFGRGENEYAARLLKQATREISDDSDAYYLLGFAYDALGKKSESQRALQRGIELAPDSTHAAKAKDLLARAAGS
ncbi:MAG: tetratricopeptide repeat protein [Kiritimatiellae bacterium]|nr:tetratricopeptide repeat protein [Kiritimatiellia bacterium]